MDLEKAVRLALLLVGISFAVSVLNVILCLFLVGTLGGQLAFGDAVLSYVVSPVAYMLGTGGCV